MMITRADEYAVSVWGWRSDPGEFSRATLYDLYADPDYRSMIGTMDVTTSGNTVSNSKQFMRESYIYIIVRVF